MAATQLKRISKKYFIGKSSSSEWASVYHYQPTDEQIFAEKGELFAVISLLSPKGFNAPTAGNLVLDAFHEAYFESRKEKLTEAISEAVSAARERLGQLLDKEPKIAELGVDLDISAISIRREEVYFAAFGSHKLLLLPGAKADKLLDISETLKDPYGKGLIRIGSALLKPDTRIALLTEVAANEIGDEDKLYALRAFDDLRFKNQDFEQESLVAAFLVGFQLQVNDAHLHKAVSIAEAEAYPRVIAQESHQEETSENTNTPEPNSETFLEEEERPAEFNKAEESLLKAKVAFLEQLKDLLKKLGQRYKQYKKNKQLKGLERERTLMATGASPDNLGAVQGRGVVPGSVGASIDAEEIAKSSTAKAILLKLRAQFNYYKDIFLYDLLHVNQKGKFIIKRNSLSFKVLVLVAVVLVIVSGYFMIRSYRANQIENRGIEEQYDEFLKVRAEIDEISNSPVLSSRSFDDIPQRERLLARIEQVEQSLIALDKLDADELDPEKDRLEDYKQQVLRVRRPEFSLLVDVANQFSGEIVDAIQIERNLYLLDSANGRIYRQPVLGGNAEVLLEGLQNPTSIAADDDNNLVVYEAGADNVISIINPTNGSKRSVSGVSSNSLPRANSMVVYDLTNGLYTINPDNQTVYLLNRVGENYSLPQTRFSSNDLGVLSDLVIIDAKIIVLSQLRGLVQVGIEQIEVDAFTSIQEQVRSGDVLGNDSQRLYVVDNESDKLITLTNTQPSGVNASVDFIEQIPLEVLEEQVVSVQADTNLGIVVVVTTRGAYSIPRQ
ncbi:MAG: hypothetical protein ACOCXP_00575 [Candidatus Dojkabacteria bacterium]